MSIKVDEEFQNLIPPLSKEEYTQLEMNIIKEGIRDPLVVWHVPNGDDILIDGHNRWNISAHHGGIRFDIVRKTFDNREEVKEWIIKNQLGRRNIPPYVRAELALKLKPVIAAKAKENQGSRTDISQNSVKSRDTQKELAKAAGVSHDTIHKVEKIQQKAPEAVKEKLRKGEMSINQVYGWISKEEHPNKYQQAAKEFREAEKRNEEYEEQKAEGVVSLADAKQNKEDQERIFEGFLRSFNDTHFRIAQYRAMMEDGEFRKKLSYGDKYAIRDITNKLGNDLRTIMKMQRIAEEVNDEKQH